MQLFGAINTLESTSGIMFVKSMVILNPVSEINNKQLELPLSIIPGPVKF